jgi:hypothetical protein
MDAEPPPSRVEDPGGCPLVGLWTDYRRPLIVMQKDILSRQYPQLHGCTMGILGVYIKALGWLLALVLIIAGVVMLGQGNSGGWWPLLCGLGIGGVLLYQIRKKDLELARYIKENTKGFATNHLLIKRAAAIQKLIKVQSSLNKRIEMEDSALTQDYVNITQRRLNERYKELGVGDHSTSPPALGSWAKQA